MLYYKDRSLLLARVQISSTSIIWITFAMHFSDLYTYITEWLQVLQEKYRRLEETSRRHDQALRQTKLIVKFRESEIKRLKDKSKEELPIDEETKAIIVSF